MGERAFGSCVAPVQVGGSQALNPQRSICVSSTVNRASGVTVAVSSTILEGVQDTYSCAPACTFAQVGGCHWPA